MVEVIAIANQKGGVGKTTTAVNLSASLALLGKKVLLIDFDPQANASTSLGFTKSKIEFSIFHVLSGRKDLSQIAKQTEIEGLFLAPSSKDLIGFDKEYYAGSQDKRFLLRNRISSFIAKYDFVLIDCSPMIGALTINALIAANSVIVPVQCEFLALEGIGQISEVINLLKSNLDNQYLYIRGFLPTMFAQNTNLSKMVLDDLVNNLENTYFFKNYENEYITIPRNIKLAQAPSYGKPIASYDNKCSGHFAYMDLAQSLISNSKG